MMEEGTNIPCSRIPTTQAAQNVKKKSGNPHAGHRNRVRARYRRAGLDSFAPHEVLELLLFYAQPRSNTNDIAHALMEKFGSLSTVLDASYEELTSVEKVGDAAATLLCLLPQLFRRYSIEKEELRVTFDTLSKVMRYCQALFVGATVEQIYLLSFDNSMHILDCTLLSHGTVNSAPVVTRRIAEKALEKHASCVVIAHNHPNGLPLPSREDLAVTQQIEQAMALFQIPLLEHILVAGTECVPLLYKERGLERHTTLGYLKSNRFLSSFYEISAEDEINPSASP